MKCFKSLGTLFCVLVGVLSSDFVTFTDANNVNNNRSLRYDIAKLHSTKEFLDSFVHKLQEARVQFQELAASLLFSPVEDDSRRNILQNLKANKGSFSSKSTLKKNSYSFADPKKDKKLKKILNKKNRGILAKKQRIFFL
mmetsp:Transcript_12938/g.14984  ORF Transcript_12938/g.14984 Transcript_12938/m.14984 type:complete len:140 (-) Transcript_12938:90-509(-)